MQQRTDQHELTPADFESETPARAWASRPLARARACWPGALRATFPEFGALSLRLCGLALLERQSTAGIGSCESFSLWRQGRCGRLDVDARFAVAASALLLGLSPGLSLARRLSPGERGAFCGLIAATLDQVGAPLEVEAEVPDAVPLRLDVQVEFDLRLTPSSGAPIVGWGRAFFPSSWTEGASVWWPSLARVPFPVAIEAARCQVDREAWASLAPGDALVFDGYPAPTSTAPQEVRLSLGPFEAAATLLGEDLSLAGGFAPAALPVTFWAAGFMGPIASSDPTWKGSASMSRTVEMGPASSTLATPETASPALAHALANTPVEVVAELGRFALTGAELAGLEGGQVLTLGGASRGEVTLAVAGRPVAKGVLVNVDGAFGVRVTARL